MVSHTHLFGVLVVMLVGLLHPGISVYIPPGPRYVCPERVQMLYPCECVSGEPGLIIRCENSNLASVGVALNNLATLRMPVEELLLLNCHIGRLYGSLLYKLNVRILKVVNTPLKTIEENLFLGVNRTLQELHVVNTSLNNFPKEAFKILGNLTVLNIDQHNISVFSKYMLHDSLLNNGLEKLHVTNGKLTDFPIESLQSLRRLKTLDLHGNNITLLKKNQFKGLRDVEILDLSHNNLKKLEAVNIADLTKLSWCNVSHNGIEELTRGTFARNAVLRVLNMSNNKLKRLDTNSFRGMRFLRRLYLSDNFISDIGRGTFGSVTRIGTIDLARNQIKKIDYQMFHQLNYVEIIDVSENNITEIQKLAFKDLYLTRINVSHNFISTIEDGAFENCANITVLDMSHNNISDIPKHTFDATTYPTELQLSYNRLTAMNQIPLHNMTGLKILNVSYNLISTVPRNTFPKLYELHTIDLSHNNLTEIHNAVFQTLFSLRSLNLSYNSMETIRSSTFGTLPTLLEMDMSNNKLKDIAPGALTKLASLRELNVEHNFLDNMFTLPISLGHLKFANNLLSEIPEKTWPSMNALLSLDMSNNRLANNLKHGSFSSLLTLQRLGLSGNGITKVPWESLSEITALQYLYLRGNNLTTLPRSAFGRLPVVFELDLSNNMLHNISSRAFEGLLQLLTLNMSSNDIHHIPNGAFQGLVSLRVLDLSHNSIEKLDNKTNGLLDDCLSLEKIDLSHNKISYVTRKTFPSNPYIPYRLREIDLSYNNMPVLTYDIIFGTRKVQTLNVSHNMLNDIRRGVLGNLTALETLDLSFNDLNDLTTEADIFNLPKNITNILMNNNRINSIPVDKIVNATNLKVLDLRNNELQLFPDKFVPMMKNGLDVYFEGNPLQCNCFIRPLKHYLATQTTPKAHYDELVCSAPLYVQGKHLKEVNDDHLNCVDNIKTQDILKKNPDIFNIQPDLKFRNIFFAKDAIHVQWYVIPPADIADFYITIRDLGNTLHYEKNVPYSARDHDIDIGKDQKLSAALKQNGVKKDGGLQLCVLARDSEGNVRGWFEEQCKMLPKDLYKVKNKFTSAVKSVYSIFSTEIKKIQGRIGGSSSDCGRISVNANLIVSIFVFVFLRLKYFAN